MPICIFHWNKEKIGYGFIRRRMQEGKGKYGYGGIEIYGRKDTDF